jgi:hypothetical protein
MRLKPASRTAKVPPLRFVSMLTVRAGLTGICFVLQDKPDAFRFGLIFGVDSYFPVIPLTDFLVVALAKADRISNVSNVAIDNHVRFPLNSNIMARLILCSMSRMTRACLAFMRALACTVRRYLREPFFFRDSDSCSLANRFA